MRTTNILALVVSTSVLALGVLSGCGDASGTSQSNYHKANYDDTSDTDPTAGKADQQPTGPAQPCQTAGRHRRPAASEADLSAPPGVGQVVGDLDAAAGDHVRRHA